MPSARAVRTNRSAEQFALGVRDGCLDDLHALAAEDCIEGCRERGQAYADLIQQVRKTAGAAMRDAWNSPPNDSDHTMNVPPSVVDLSALAPYETGYIDAVRTHLRTLAPWWAS